MSEDRIVTWLCGQCVKEGKVPISGSTPAETLPSPPDKCPKCGGDMKGTVLPGNPGWRR